MANTVVSFRGEGRKRVPLIAAAILGARKLCQFSPDAGRVPATITAVVDAVEWAHRLIREIDKR